MPGDRASRKPTFSKEMTLNDDEEEEKNEL